MNKKEICFKLIELYYTKKTTFNNYDIYLEDLFKIYNKMLKILDGGSNE